MITLNPFVENNKARINQFLNNLCEVGDFYDTLEVCVHRLERMDVRCLSSVSFPVVRSDGPVYGPVEEGPPYPHHAERALQHTFINFATYRGPCRCRVLSSLIETALTGVLLAHGFVVPE